MRRSERDEIRRAVEAIAPARAAYYEALAAAKAAYDKATSPEKAAYDKARATARARRLRRAHSGDNARRDAETAPTGEN